jgi:hypothetical protein
VNAICLILPQEVSITYIGWRGVVCISFTAYST